MDSNDEARRNLADYAQFTVRISGLSEADLMTEWPELYSPNVDARATIQMYKRAANEARRVWGRYPMLASLLS